MSHAGDEYRQSPFVEAEQAVDAVMACCPEIPFWPQLPRRSFYENMYVQCLERTPALVVDPASATVYVDTRKTEGIEKFYEEVYDETSMPSAYRSRRRPVSMRFSKDCRRRRTGSGYVKGQLTGPFTLGIGLKDENGKPVIYDSAYFDIIKKVLRMKAAWMIKAIKRVCPDKEVLLFFDEPALVSFGSAFVSVSSEAVTSLFDEVREGLDALVGVHCAVIRIGPRFSAQGWISSTTMPSILWKPSSIFLGSFQLFLQRGEDRPWNRAVYR